MKLTNFQIRRYRVFDDVANYRAKSGNRKTRMKKWSDVISKLVIERGKLWEEVESLAKKAFADSLLETSDNTFGNASE